MAMVWTTKTRLQEGFNMTTLGFINPQIRSNGYGLDNKGLDLLKVSTNVSAYRHTMISTQMSSNHKGMTS